MTCMNLSLYGWLFLRFSLSYMYVPVCRYVHLSVGAWGFLLELSYEQAESYRLGTEFQLSYTRTVCLSLHRALSLRSTVSKKVSRATIPTNFPNSYNQRPCQWNSLSNGLFWDRISWCHPDRCRIHFAGQAGLQFRDRLPVSEVLALKVCTPMPGPRGCSYECSFGHVSHTSDHWA